MCKVYYLNVKDAKDLLESGAILLDTRHKASQSNTEYYCERVLQLATFEIIEKINELDKDAVYILADWEGLHLYRIYNLMRANGYRFVYCMEGGLKQWTTQNRALQLGEQQRTNSLSNSNV